MTWSEFGRRVQENAQDGTDHGSAAPMFLLGNGVKGGFYGERRACPTWTTATCVTPDFRSVYATVLESWLEVSPEQVLGGHFDRLDLIAG